MAIPLDLRNKEEVIDEFGISLKYSILLVVAGLVILTAILLIRAFKAVAFANLSEQLGSLGPLILNGAFVLIVLIGLYLIILGIYFHFAYHYYLTTERVIESSGMFSQRTVSADYKTVSDLIIRQDAIGHLILETGTLGVNTFGGIEEEVELLNIDNPTARREQLRGLSEAVQEGMVANRTLLQRLKQQTGMLASNNMAAPEVDQFTAPEKKIVDMLEGVTHPESPAIKPATPQVDESAEESDRLRAAQQKLDK